MGAAGATAAEATVTAAAAMREGGDRGNKNRTADEAVGCRSNTREGEWRRRRARGRGDESKGATAAAAATGEELEVKQFSEVEQLVCLGVGTQIIMKTVWKSNA